LTDTPLREEGLKEALDGFGPPWCQPDMWIGCVFNSYPDQWPYVFGLSCDGVPNVSDRASQVGAAMIEIIEEHDDGLCVRLGLS
jgi:hypothetical protein